VLLLNLLSGVDSDDDGYLSLREVTGFILDKLKYLNISLTPEVKTNVNSYLDVMDSSIQGLLSKYNLKDVSQCILMNINPYIN
jgi:hypothetical protein